MKGLQSGVRLVVRKGLLLKAAGIEAGEKPAVRIGKLGGVITGGDMALAKCNPHEFDI